MKPRQRILLELLAPPGLGALIYTLFFFVQDFLYPVAGPDEVYWPRFTMIAMVLSYITMGLLIRLGSRARSN